MRYTFLLATLLLSLAAIGQNFEKIVVETSDSVAGHYLAIPPMSGIIKGTLVVFCPFRGPESILPETKLHNVAAANDLLTIYASVGFRLFPDEHTMDWMNRVFSDVLSRYKVDSSTFAVGGFDMAGMSVLRYAELAREHPDKFALRPGVVFGIASPVDLTGLYHIYERQLKRNFFVGDARFFLDKFNKELGTLAEHPERYEELTPFNSGIVGADGAPAAGHELLLKQVAVRLYYDTDISWQLKTRRNGYYDTYLPDGSEMIDRLLLEGDQRAEFVASRLPGVRSNGMRHTSAYSIVDETDCIQWINRELHIFSPSNPMAFVAPYKFVAPEGWPVERSSFPPPFAPGVRLKGIEEIRFTPGWGVASSPEYWSLAYMMWLDAGQTIDAEVLREAVKTYYDGLIVNGGGGGPRNIPKDKLVPTVVHVQKVKAEADDQETYVGTVDMLDYMAMKPIRLNLMAHVKRCGEGKSFPMFWELSPKAFEDGIWGRLEEGKRGFSCTLNK